MRLRAAVVLCMLSVASTTAGARAAEHAQCAPAHAGGDWTSYGHDLSNTRAQDAEHTIGAGNVLNLAPRWYYNAGTAGDANGLFQNTPVVANGCVYIGSTNGVVKALNADDGTEVWSTSIPVSATNGGAIVGSPTVQDGKVFLIVNELTQPYAVALNQADGSVAWTSLPVTNYKGARSNASPVIFDGLFFYGYSGPEGDPNQHGGYAILDENTGVILHHEYVVPQETWKYGYGGGGIWATAVVDQARKYAYAGTSNPTSKTTESPRVNAIVKIDLDRNRPTFGTIVDVYKGTVDGYFPGLDRQPVCQTVGPHEPSFAFTCTQQDLDFGASPNMFTDAQGNLLVGSLQKSGVYHVVYADTMEMAWTAIMGPPCLQCNADSTAIDANAVYGETTPPGQEVSLNRNTGGYNWVTPVADGLHFQATSVANGVVYTVDSEGFLDAFDAATGVPLLKRSVSADAGAASAPGTSSSGVSIARNTVFVASGGTVAAYAVP
jgi:outer membrane protein assembly factor BamB